MCRCRGQTVELQPIVVHSKRRSGSVGGAQVAELKLGHLTLDLTIGLFVASFDPLHQLVAFARDDDDVVLGQALPVNADIGFQMAPITVESAAVHGRVSVVGSELEAMHGVASRPSDVPDGAT